MFFIILLRLKEKLAITIFFVIFFAVYCAVNQIMEFELMYFTQITMISIVYRLYIELDLDFSNYKNMRSLDSKMADQNKLLKYLLPHHIRDQFLLERQTKQLNLCDNFDDVTILFADIAGFTSYSASVKPE